MVCKNFPGDTAATKNICILFFLAVRCPCAALCAFLRLFVAICTAAFQHFPPFPGGLFGIPLPPLSGASLLPSVMLLPVSLSVVICWKLSRILSGFPLVSLPALPLSLFPDLPRLSLFLSGGALPFVLSLPLCRSLFPVRVLLASLPFCPSLCPPALLCCVNLADTPSASR